MRKLFILSVSSLLIMSLLIFGVGCEYLESQTQEQEAATESTTEDSTATPESTTDTELESTETFVHSSAYIKFDGVDGEAMSAGHEGWSEIISFSQGRI